MPFTELPLQNRLPATQSEFPHVEGDDSAPGDPQSGDYASRIKGMIDDAREFCAEVLLPIRVTGIQYYLGMLPEVDDDSEGTSSIVKTEVRDTILQMMPSLMRLFCGQDEVTKFQPNREDQADIAEQQTDYLKYVVFNDNPGYMIIQNTFKDALVKAMGVVGWRTDSNIQATEETYERLSLEQRQFVISQPGVEVVDMVAGQTPGPQGEIIPTFDMRVRRVKTAAKHLVFSIPPDEFRVNRTATSVKDAALVGRESFETQTTLLRRGVPLELIAQNRDFSGGDMRFTEERMLRNSGLDSPFGRDSMEPMVRWGEYWIRADKDGDGLAELRHVCVIGDNAVIVHDEPAARAKIAIACCDPEPHSIVGHSYSELVYDLQVIGSNLLRGSLDSMAQSIYPRLWGVDNQVNWDDLLNTAIGAPIRVKSADSIGQLQYDFIGEDAFSMMDRLDAIRMARTGITEQSKGLDPKALQSTTLKGVEMVVQGAQERIELVARTMASTFFVDLMSGLLQEVTDNPSPERVVALRGKYVPVNPSQFDATMNCVPNPALGKGSDSDKFLALQFVISKQEAIIAQMGPMNPMVSPVEYRNALEDTLKIPGLMNVGRYFKPMGENEMKQLQQTLQQKEDPQMVYAKAEADKVRATIVKILADARTKVEDLYLKDDRERDSNESSALLKAAEIDAKYGAAVDTAAIRSLWSAPRVPPTQAGIGDGSGGPGAPGAPPEGPPLPGAPGAPPGGMGAPGPLPKLPQRTALGAGPPELPEAPNGPPAGLLGP